MLSGRLALVTGGGSGIGRAVCQVLAREGARVVSADLNEASAKETAAMLPGQEHVGVMLDVSSEESVAAVVTFISGKYGQPASCVVNCAGILQGCGSLHDMSEDTFMRTIDVNLKGTFLVTKQASKAIIEAAVKGSIVNIASIAAKQGPTYAGHYAASKGGVESFTRTSSRELGPKGIRCNAVLPGYIATPMVTVLSEEKHQGYLSRTPLGRAGQPEEVAEVVAFLCSERASYMTGSSVYVSGGGEM